MLEEARLNNVTDIVVDTVNDISTPLRTCHVIRTSCRARPNPSYALIVLSDILQFVNGIVSQHPNPKAAEFLIEEASFPVNRQAPNNGPSMRSKNASANPTSSAARTNTEGLPILDHRDRLMTAIHAQRVTCIEGETGCGKSTQVPQFILDDWKRYGMSVA